MLRAKSKTKLTKKKSQALKEVMKDDDIKAVYAKIPRKSHQKLRLKLTLLDMTFDEWLVERIREM